jgi:hypothetical protein
MRFLLGVLVGYTVRGKHKLLIRVLVTLALVVYVVLPTIALLALSLDVQRECTETDLREFYQILCFRPTLNKNSAGVFISRIQRRHRKQNPT